MIYLKLTQRWIRAIITIIILIATPHIIHAEESLPFPTFSRLSWRGSVVFLLCVLFSFTLSSTLWKYRKNRGKKPSNWGWNPSNKPVKPHPLTQRLHWRIYSIKKQKSEYELIEDNYQYFYCRISRTDESRSDRNYPMKRAVFSLAN